MMLDRLAELARSLTRKVDFYADDTFIVSYPKSGNTWVRFFIANLARPEVPVNFTTVHAIVPDLYKIGARSARRLPRPRVLKSHEYFDPRYGKVIYVVRDPRDVVLSYFHFQLRKRQVAEGASLNDYVERFLSGRLDRFGTWREHVGSWIGARACRSDFLLVRYEDLAHEPMRQFGRIAQFAGFTAAEAELDAAVRRSSFTEMRALEVAQVKDGTLEPERLEKPFLRSGQVGGWIDHLDPGLAQEIAAASEPFISSLGYRASATSHLAPGLGMDAARAAAGLARLTPAAARPGPAGGR